MDAYRRFPLFGNRHSASFGASSSFPEKMELLLQIEIPSRVTEAGLVLFFDAAGYIGPVFIGRH